MLPVISSFQPFSCISWWAMAAGVEKILFDKAEHFQKASFRNRYIIDGANGAIMLTIPLRQGRNQRVAMKDVQIYNEVNWQIQHWRSLSSAYNRTPYFSHYEPDLKKLFEKKFNWLVDFDLASFEWLMQQIDMKLSVAFADTFQGAYNDMSDLRNFQNQQDGFPQYQQVFADRHGFVSDISLLDLLFAEGPQTMYWIRKHRSQISGS